VDINISLPPFMAPSNNGLAYFNKVPGMNAIDVFKKTEGAL
jgi:hypothetical protein